MKGKIRGKKKQLSVYMTKWSWTNEGIIVIVIIYFLSQH